MAKLTLDWNKYREAAREAVAEGVVLLENNGALPLKKDAVVAVFGRMQDHYYKSGTGSGGMVNVSKVWNIPEGLTECGVTLCSELRDIYAEWEKDNPVDYGVGWGGEPWSQAEMPVSAELAARIAEKSTAALCIIGRTAGEEQDQSERGGSYMLTETELSMLKNVRAAFSEMTVVLNVGGIIDMGWADEIKPDALMYAWQGGMEGGLGTADVLTGRVSPSGKLPDTIAKTVADYPSTPYFGNATRNFYAEDIYVGYRYFETFKPKAVRYPFGFGLSYTRFALTTAVKNDKTRVVVDVKVKNIGEVSGKEVVQVYAELPQGKLGKPFRTLCGYAKTNTLDPGEEQALTICVNLEDFASYDDSGVTGHRFCYILEGGTYGIAVGTDVRSAQSAALFSLPETVVKQCETALAPVLAFDRMVNKGGELAFEPAPLCTKDMDERRAERLPAEIPQTGDKGIKLVDVKSGKNTMDEFVAQMTDEALACIIRAEGMGSPKVTAGTAAAFGGVSKELVSLGIPCGCCDDGPSGMRLDCGTKAFSLPNGTLLASTFNTELLERLYSYTGVEVAANNVECLLGPGMNIHRHPLNGRNFEYFSEDPFLTGTAAAAQLKGLHSAGVTGTIKHFCGNNQETGRHVIDTVASERALREIYLKGFEIAIKDGGATTVMTTYGSVNGLWTAGSYDLCTTILRGEWGFDGMVMTDWWADINERGKPQRQNNLAQMARAQNDVYMVCADSENNSAGDNTLEELRAGKLTRGELQRCAANICRFLMKTHAMSRPEIEIINRPNDEDDLSSADVKFYDVDGELVIPLSDVETKSGSSYVFGLDMKKIGMYKVTLTASSDSSRTAQIPVTFFTTGFPGAVFTFNGTDGKFVSIERNSRLYSRFITCRLYFGQSGLKLRDIRFEFCESIKDGAP